MRILVTGGCGFIGTNICIEASGRGHDVIAFDNFSRPGTESNLQVLKHYGIEVVRGDIRNPEDFERIRNIDGICQLSANPGIPWSISNPIYDFNVNAGGALNVLEYSRTHGKAPVVFASTNKVYSEQLNELPIRETKTRYEWPLLDGINESYPMDGVGKYSHSPYGVSKASADLYHQEYYQTFGVPTVINRMSCIYGRFQHGVSEQGWIDHFIRTVLKGNGKLTIFGDGKQVRDMLWGGDVARLYIDELENIDKVKGQVFNIGGGPENTLSLLESLEIIEQITGQKAKLKFEDWRIADQKIYISDITKVKKILGWKPAISPVDGIEAMVSNYA